MSDGGESSAPRRGVPPTALAAGGILAAVGAASCCLVPFALFALGVSGAWISDLTALAPYQPIFLTVAAGLVGYGFVLVYRRPTPSAACVQEALCAHPRSSRIAKAGLWVALLLVVAAMAFPYLARLYLP